MNVKYLIITASLGLLLISTFAFAQEADRFYNFSRRDGLASGSVTSIVQDHQGIMWIGTKLGVNRYDGVDFAHLHTGNSGLPSNDISSLHISDQSTLWIGTVDKGLYLLDLFSRQISPIQATTAVGNHVIAIGPGWDSTVWVLSEEGLSVFGSEGTLLEGGLLKNFAGRLRSAVAMDSSIWVGTNDSQVIAVRSDGSLGFYSLGDYGLGISVQAIHTSDDENLLIGTRQHGLLQFDITSQSVEAVAIEASDIRDIVRDKEGAFWICTDGNGLYKMTLNSVSNFLHESAQSSSLVSNAVQVCFEDRDGNLWLGSSWDGISFKDKSSENLTFYYSDFQGVSKSGVLNIFVDKNNLLLGTDGAGLSIKNDRQTPKTLFNWIPQNSYVQFVDRINSRYWIGTFQSGFYSVDDSTGNSKTHHTISTGLSHNDVRDILFIDESTYLIATWGGGLNLYNLTENEIRQLGTHDGRPKDVVTLHQISKNEVLVGTFGQGVFLLSLDDFSTTRILTHLDNVVSIAQNSHGLWIGTWGEGLHYSDSALSSSSLILDGNLTENSNIFSIVSSKEGELIWFSTSDDIYKVEDDFKVTRMPFPRQQFHINASAEDSLGRVYFGGTEGVFSFRTNDLQAPNDRIVELTDVKVGDRSLLDQDGSIPGADQVVLDHFQNLLTFEYTTPVYPRALRENYQVKLLPIYDEWMNTGGERSMTFADLSPGTYEFKVKNRHSKHERVFKFRILNPWWKTWWSYLIACIIFFSLLFSFRRYSVKLERIRSQLQIEKIGREKDVEVSEIKQRFFVNVSHEIRTPLTLIIGEIDQISSRLSSSKAVSNSLNNIRNNGNHLMQLVNELLDFRKLDQEGIKLKVAPGDFVKFCKEIFLSFLNKAEYQKIDYRFSSEVLSSDIYFDRDQLEKVFYNLLSNAFKNTPPSGVINFKVSESNDSVLAEIEDTGIGIPANELKDIFKRFYQREDNANSTVHGFGIGLSIVKDIVTLHQGRVTVHSSEGAGSKFLVSLKRGREHFEDAEIAEEYLSSESVSGYEDIGLEDRKSFNSHLAKEVLVVEDNEAIRDFLIQSLSDHFKVRGASSGEEAMDLIKEGLPDLIISDVMMPGMDGITLTKELKNNKQTSHVPVILLTARTGTIFKKEGFETGADDYITKPFSSSVLLARIKNILRSREALTSQIRNEIALKPEDLNLSTPDEKFLRELVHVTQQNLGNSELNAELIASEMGMSHSVVYKKIKALTGFNLVEFVRDYRLQQAGEMLRKYKFSVAETCYKVGFSDKKYFSQIFKKKYGVTPSQYLKGAEDSVGN